MPSSWNQQENLAGTITVYRADGTVVSTTNTSHLYKVDQLIRPALVRRGVKSPIVPSFTLPTPYNTDHYWQRRIRGNLVITQVAGGGIGQVTRVTDGALANYVPPNYGYMIPQDSAVSGRLANKLLDKLKGQDINLGQAFAERHQLSVLFLSTAKKLSKLWIACKRRDIRAAASALGVSSIRRLPKTAAQMWLEYRYGWMPLVMDFYGAAEAVAKANRKEKMFTLSVKANVKSEASEKRTSVSSFFNYRYTERRMTSGFGRVDFFVNNPLLHAAASTGLTNPLSLAWELAPYSFVADWFLPVGGFFDVQDATLGLTALGFTSSIRTERSLQIFGRGRGRVINATNEGSSWADLRSISLDRSASSSFPTPTFPQLTFDIGLKNFLTGIALLIAAKSAAIR